MPFSYSNYVLFRAQHNTMHFYCGFSHTEILSFPAPVFLTSCLLYAIFMYLPPSCLPAYYFSLMSLRSPCIIVSLSCCVLAFRFPKLSPCTKVLVNTAAATNSCVRSFYSRHLVSECTAPVLLSKPNNFTWFIVEEENVR